MSSDYAWMITHDYQHDRNPQLGDTAGTYGPAGITPIQRERVVRGEPFRLYTEEGDIAATGRCLCKPDDDAAYSPLEEAGVHGAADIRYHDRQLRKWVSL